MRSIIFASASKYLLPLLLLFSFYILLRGHNDPGGGFIGGLVAAAAYSLFTIANGVQSARLALGVQPSKLIAFGLLFAGASGLIPLFYGMPFMTGMWPDIIIPGIGKLSTPLLFDTGVYLVVIGVILIIIFSLAEE
jgi:multicomponent Na+:H+ antiporter subunit B